MTVMPTFSPALQLVLQFLDHDAQTAVLLFLLLVFLLPLLGRQLQVHRYCVLNGFSSGTQNTLSGAPSRQLDLLRFPEDVSSHPRGFTSSDF